MKKIEDIFALHSIVEEEVIFEGELLEEEYIIIKSNIEKIAREILAEYNKFLLKNCNSEISNDSINSFIYTNL